VEVVLEQVNRSPELPGMALSQDVRILAEMHLEAEYRIYRDHAT